MEYEKQLTVIREGKTEEYGYFVRKKDTSDFGCSMYNVGIRVNGREREIEDFSPSFDEAVKLCDYMYKEQISQRNIFSAAEEFIISV